MPEPSGDCDDFSMLCAAMLRALGIESAFKTIAADSADPTRYSHVYVMAIRPEGELALDCSHGSTPGWEAPAVGKTRLWPLEKTTMRSTNMRGLGDDGDGIDWESILNTGITQAGSVLKTALVPAGTYISGPQGTTYRAPTGTAAASAMAFPGFGSMSINSTELMLLGGALLLVLFVGMGKRG
jgi:hypothetical protein